jgi:transcriptional regulator with XRE-family HTH domain
VNFVLDTIRHYVYIDNMTKGQFKELREAIDYSQAKLAKEMGVTIRTITRWETGEFPIPRIAELALRSVVQEALGKIKKTVSWEKIKKDLRLETKPRKH